MAENDRKLSSFDEMGYDNSTKVLIPALKYSSNDPNAQIENRNIPLELFYKHIFLKSEWVDYIINDPSWLRADTFSWHSGDSNEANSYVKVYDHLLNDIAGKSLISETIAGITIQYYLADDKHKICPASQENNVLSLYNSIGVAWYYIIDTTNQRFKLPRTKFGFVGVRDNVGNYVNESLPNIKGTFGAGFTQGNFFNTGNGAFGSYRDNSKNANVPSNGSAYPNNNMWDFNASRSSSVYQDNATVQQRATQMYLYFYVGEYTMSSIENIAGQNMSIVNQKADIDAQNFNATGKSYLAGLSFLSNNYDNLILGASGTTYTAQANGEFRFSLNINSNNYFAIFNGNTGNVGELIDIAIAAINKNYVIKASVRKGQTIRIQYSSYITNNSSRFYYAKGEI